MEQAELETGGSDQTAHCDQAAGSCPGLVDSRLGYALRDSMTGLDDADLAGLGSLSVMRGSKNASFRFCPGKSLTR
jgi:hypothetical protein